MKQKNKMWILSGISMISMLSGTLGASLLGNLFAGKGIVRAGSGNNRGKGIIRAGSGDLSQNKMDF